MIKCTAFQMKDSNEALNHIKNNWEVIEDYGDYKYDHSLHTFDSGKRVLGKCKECDQLILLQESEYHSFSDKPDSYYDDYFPVSSKEEADELNKKYDGFKIETEFNNKWLCVTNSNSIWKNENSNNE